MVSVFIIPQVLMTTVVKNESTKCLGDLQAEMDQNIQKYGVINVELSEKKMFSCFRLLKMSFFKHNGSRRCTIHLVFALFLSLNADSFMKY